MQCGITNPEEDGSLKDQDSNVESVPSVSNEELEEFNAGEKVDDSEILENIISNVCGLFMEESVEEQPSLQKFKEEIPLYLNLYFFVLLLVLFCLWTLLICFGF